MTGIADTDTAEPRVDPSHGRGAGAELIDEGAGYSKDYWDLVLEQLGRRALFRTGMWILAGLYGLAIFAPLIGNDRPYKLVAIDYGSYERSLNLLEPLSRSLLAELSAAEEQVEEQPVLDSQAEADASESGPDPIEPGAREVEALRTRMLTLREYLPEGQREQVDAFEEQVVEAFDARDPGLAEGVVATAARLGEDLQPQRGGEAGVPLRPKTSYPLAESLGWMSVLFMLLWIVGASFPFWNRLWNAALLEGDRERIRGARRQKWAVLLGVPGGGALAWALVVGGGGEPFDVAPYKLGMSDGSIVAVEPPLMAPMPIGYAETHKEERFRPPTWLDYARLDANGRYMVGDRVAKPDPVTGFLPPATPVVVRYGEPWPNAPHRHLAGTDELGRDFFVRMLWGARVSLAVGILSAVLLTVIGVFFGSLAGYFGGWVDIVIMRVIEVLQSIPAFFLILASLAFFGSSSGIPPIFVIVVVIALVRWTGTARLVRGEFLRLREQEYVVAARALGFSNRRTIFKHVLPNALGPVLVSAAFAVASGILTESAVSFLGFGVKHPQASWGSLVNESKEPSHWWIQVFPGVLIFITVTCYNLVGDAVRDALDPKMKV